MLLNIPNFDIGGDQWQPSLLSLAKARALGTRVGGETCVMKGRATCATRDDVLRGTPPRDGIFFFSHYLLNIEFANIVLNKNLTVKTTYL